MIRHTWSDEGRPVGKGLLLKIFALVHEFEHRRTEENPPAELPLVLSEDELWGIDLFQEGQIRGSTHTYIGMEASGVGACSALRADDYITSTHRGHGHCIAKGGRLDLMMAELLGKATGYCKGKGGSMHIADVEAGILGANGIVGGGIGIATGAALGSQMRGDGRVTVCFFGDGGFNQGVLYECAN